jgi:hypothetical protein
MNFERPPYYDQKILEELSDEIREEIKVITGAYSTNINSLNDCDFDRTNQLLFRLSSINKLESNLLSKRKL